MASPLARNRRDADPAVNDAVASVFKNQKFKRMMVFSIKFLSDFCVPPNNRYKENSLAIVEHQDFPKLLESLPNFKGDDEVLSLFGRVFFGISEGLVEDRSSISKVTGNNVPRYLTSAMAGGVSDPDGITYYLDAIKNFNSLNVPIDIAEVVPGLLQALKPKMKEALRKRLLAAIDQASREKRGCQTILEKNGVPTIMSAIGLAGKASTFVIVNRDCDKPSNESIVHGLNAIRNVVELDKGATKIDVESVIAILENNKSCQAIQTAGSSLIAASLNADDMQKCLQVLQTSAPNSAERAHALTVLSSMSYIAGCADKISQQGGIPLIVTALNQALKEVGDSADAKISKSICGISRVLGVVAEKSADERKKVLDAQGLESLIEAVQKCDPTKYGEAYTTALSALARLGVDERTHTKLSSCCHTIVKNMSLGNQILPASAEILDLAGACSGFKQAQAPTQIAKYANSLPNDSHYNAHIVSAAAKMMHGSWAEIGPMVTECSKMIGERCVDEGVAVATPIFLRRATECSVEIPNADWSATVEAALSLLLEYSDNNPAIASVALQCLEALATEKDVSRTLTQLSTAVSAAHSNPGRCLKCLAAVNGLSQLSALRPAFEKHNARSVIAEGLRQWISASKFNDQARTIKYGCQCVTSLISSKPVDDVLKSVLETALMPSLKTLRDRQDDAIENSLNEVAKVIEIICDTRNFAEAATISESVDSIIKCIRKYPESKVAQISFINALSSIASVSKEAAHTIIDSGALKTILTYMNRVAMFGDVQKAGCKLLLILAQTDERCLQKLKGTDTLSVVQNARSTHKNNVELKEYAMQLLNMLIPESDLERLILDTCKESSKAVSLGNYKTVITCMENLNNATTTMSGARVSARCDMGKYLAEAQDAASNHTNGDEQIQIYEQMAMAMANMTQTAPGVNNAIKHGGVSRLCNLWEGMKNQSKNGQIACLKACARILQRDKNQCKAIFDKSLIPKICMWSNQNMEDADVLIASANLLTSIPNQKELLKYDEYRRWLANMCHKLNEDGPADLKLPIAQALESVLLVGDDNILDIFLKSGGLKGVYKTMDDNPRDWGLLRHCNNILDQVNRQRNLRTIIKKGGDVQLPTIGKCVKRILQTPQPEPDAVAQTLKMYNAVITSEDRDLLDQIDLLPEIEKLMLDYPNHELLLKACGDFLGKVGCDRQLDNLFKQIIVQCNDRPDKWPQHLTKLTNQLAVYLISDVTNPKMAFQSCDQAMDALASVVRDSKKLPERVAMLPVICKATRRLAKRSVDDPATPWGVPSLQTKMLGALAEMLSPAGDGPEPKMKVPRMALIDGYGTLASIARHPPAHADCVSECVKFGTLDHAIKLLDTYKDDPEVVAAILDFLAAIACDAPGATALQNTKGRRIGDAAAVADIMNLMKRFNRHQPLVNAGLELLGNLGKNQKQSPGFLADAKIAGDLNDMAKDYTALPALAKMRKNLIGKESRDATIAAITLLKQNGDKMLHDSSVSDELKDEFVLNMTDLIAASCTMPDQTAEQKKAGSIKDILDMFESRKSSIPLLCKMTRKIRESMATDADTSAKLVHGGISRMLGAGGPALQSDPMACYEMLALMGAVGGGEGNGRALGADKNIMAFLDNCYDGTCFGADGVDAPDMRGMVEQIRRMINDDQPEVLTLEKVHNKWDAKKREGETLLVAENPIVLQHMQFVHDYTEEYGKEPIDDIEAGIGLEFAFGCKCYDLLYELEPNCEPLNERNTCKLLLVTAVRQKNDRAAQCAVIAANNAVQYPKNAEVWSGESNTPITVAEILNRGRNIRNVTDIDREEMINVRLQLAERVAMNRTYFNNTECMSALVGLWDDYDKKKYSVELLKQVFKTMRRIINDHWVGLLLKHNVPQRLIDVINDKAARLDLLPDVLFLIAALAVVPEIKTMIGDLKGVEACLDLLVRSMKNPDRAATSPVLTNDCLALSAITMGHGANLQRFLQNKGVELNIQAMGQMQNNGKLDYDVANAASLLMCNTCFKRDEMKALYGKQRACEAVMKTINQYDGSEDDKAFRCLSTMFKAIGNLALYTPNVEIFMAGKIHQTFAHLYEKSDTLPDSLVEASLRTLSNLAMENTQANMISFGITLPAILYMLQQEQRSSIKMFTLAFDVLGCLCRHPDNAKTFLRERGIPTCLKILNSYSDPYLYANGIHVLGIQTTNPASVQELVNSGVFNFLTSVLETQASADDPSVDLVVSACRCIRRLMPSKEQGKQFAEIGGIQQLIALTSSLSPEHGMAHLECHRTLINLLVLFPPPTPPPAEQKGHVGDEWDDEVPDEGVLPAVETLDRPMGPRSWEQLELNKDQAIAIIISCVRVLDRDESLRQLRLVRSAIGLLAYFACEKIAGVVNAYYDASITSLLSKLFGVPDMDPEVVVSCCYILNNVAYASEAEQYMQLRRDREMRKQLDVVCQKLPQHRPFCDLTLKLLNERSADSSRFEIHQQWTYPIEYTQWNKDKYPNGVQDLPLDWKEELRSGGKFKTIVNEKDKEVLHWKSSLDLEYFQWRIDPKEGLFKNQLAVSRICSIQRGLRSDVLKVANERGSPTSKPREGEAIVLRGLPSEEFPEGVEINILCGLKRSRDRFFEILTEWREAAAFGF